MGQWTDGGLPHWPNRSIQTE